MVCAGSTGLDYTTSIRDFVEVLCGLKSENVALKLRACRGDAMAGFDVESYWSGVATEIAHRGDESVVAGDDDPFSKYKRKKSLEKFLRTLDVESKVVLEVGCGPGGNLLELAWHGASRTLVGVDISQAMIELARGTLARHGAVAELRKVDGIRLPFADRLFDLTYSVTVLQHNTDGAALKELIREMCRVTNETIVLMEDTGNEGLSGTGSYVARHVGVYESIFSERGFRLSQRLHLNTRISYLAHAVASRLFLSKRHNEGQPIGIVARTLTASVLPVSRILDDLFVERKGLTKMVFERRG